MRTLAVLSLSALTLAAQEGPKPLRATVEISATWSITEPLGAGAGPRELKTHTLTCKVPCTLKVNATPESQGMPSMATTMVPGLVASYLFTPDKDAEGQHTGTLSETESSGVTLHKRIQATLIGTANGSFGLAPTGKTDDLVPGATNILTAFFKGTETSDGRSREWRDGAPLLYLDGDLLNPMDPEVPRAHFSKKEVDAGLASGKPFTLKAEKAYDLDYKDKHHKGSYTLTITVVP